MSFRHFSHFCAYVIAWAVFSIAPSPAEAAGAGRAFPIDSENFAIENFKQVNPSVEWDPTNFLVDLSGNYANCNNLNRKGELQTDKKNPDGSPITVVIDSISGSASDVDSVNGYLRELIKRWMSSRSYNRHIEQAKRVGCSVRPGCSGNVVVACLFSSGGGSGGDGARPTPPAPLTPARGRLTLPHYRETTTKPWWDEKKDDPDKDKDWWINEAPKALAFTPEQYKLAEDIMGQSWDRAHFLENLSGFETDCQMVGSTDWPFQQMKKMAKEQNIKIVGQYGSAVNKGSTPDAMTEILKTFKPVKHTHSIGCSVIPDCKTTGNTMYVVIGCLYQEN